MGQMLRGGRSQPSETKLGAGACRAGKSCGAAKGSGTLGSTPISGTAVQQEAHRLQRSPPSCC